MTFLYYRKSAFQLEKPEPKVYKCKPKKEPCPICGENALMRQKGMETCLGFVCVTDSSGNIHYHDPNCIQGLFSCPNKHYFSKSSYYACECGWTKTKPCKICGNEIKIVTKEDFKKGVLNSIYYFNYHIWMRIKLPLKEYVFPIINKPFPNAILPLL